MFLWRHDRKNTNGETPGLSPTPVPIMNSPSSTPAYAHAPLTTREFCPSTALQREVSDNQSARSATVVISWFA